MGGGENFFTETL